MLRVRLRAFAACALLCGLLLWAIAPSVSAQERCEPFRGTIAASLVPVGGVTGFVWKGEINFTIGHGLPITGTTETVLTGVKRGGPADPSVPIYMGTEETTVRVKAGANIPESGFVLLTRFVTPQKSFYADGVGKITEVGTIVPASSGSGMFSNTHGHFNLRGEYGPAVLVPPQIPVGILGWIGEYHGTICQVD